MILLLALAAFASPVDDALQNLNADPTDPARRLSLGRALGATAGGEEDAVEVLRALLPDTSARDALVGVITREARPGWEPLYSVMLKAPDVPQRTLLRLRLDEVRANGSKTRLAALSDMRAIAKESPSTEVGVALLRAGDVASARMLLPREMTPMVDASRGWDVCAPELIAAGFWRAAVAGAPSRATAASARIVASAYTAGGQSAAAVSAWQAALKLAPKDAATRAATADALAEAYRFAEATKLIGDADPARTARYAALRGISAAYATKSKVDDRTAAEAAHALAPNDPTVLGAGAGVELANGDARAAADDLARALDIRPADRGLLGGFSAAGIAAHRPGDVAERLRVAIGKMPTPAARSDLAEQRVNLLALEAESRKLAGENAAGRAAYALAVAERPGSPRVLVGAAGMYWQDQRPDAAYSLYHAVLTIEPDNVEALMSAVTLALSVGRDEEALALLEAAPDRDIRVRTLRITVQNAMRARDARQAVRTGDLAAAEAAWRKLTQDYPGVANFLHGLADALAGLGRFDEALAAYHEAERVEPNDAWIRLGEANCLVALGRADEARTRLLDFPPDAPAAAVAQRRRVEARAWRSTGDAQRVAGADRAAFDAYAAAMELDPEQWSIVGLASLYLEHDQAPVAEAFYAEALSLDPGNDVAERGMIAAEEGSGRDGEAMERADRLVANAPTEGNRAIRAALATRVAVRNAERARLAGDTGPAEEVLLAAIAESPSADAWSALGAIRLAHGNARGAVEAVTNALKLDPANGWARGVALQAGRANRSSRAMLPLFEAAAAEGDAAARVDLLEARLDSELQDAAMLGRAGRVKDAANALKRAETLVDDADDWARIGAAWINIHRTKEATNAFDAALAMNPSHVESIIGKAGVLQARRKLGPAQKYLEDLWTPDADPRVGMMLARIKAARGFYRSARETMAEAAEHPQHALVAKEPVAVHPEPLPILALPSGRPIRPPNPPAPPPAREPPPWLAGGATSLSNALAQEDSINVSAGVGILERPGNAGEQQILAVFTPAVVGPAPVGLLRFNLDATPVWLDDGRTQDFGVGVSVGAASPARRMVYGEARFGVSPIGFDGGVYPTWNAHGRVGIGQDLAIGLQTGRAPLAHSVTSWAGAVDPLTGQRYGLVSEIWGGAYASFVSATHWDLGIFGRGGWTEGIGVEPNPIAEGVGWAGHRWGEEGSRLRIGAEGVAQTNARQEDQFVAGEGGYFSPPVYLLGSLRADGSIAFAHRHARVCANGAAGVQYMDGRATSQFGAGAAGVFEGGLGAAVHIGPRWQVSTDGRIQMTTDGYHQEGAAFRLTYGLPPSAAGSPTLSTVASPGAMLLTGDTCQAE